MACTLEWKFGDGTLFVHKIVKSKVQHYAAISQALKRLWLFTVLNQSRRNRGSMVSLLQVHMLTEPAENLKIQYSSVKPNYFKKQHFHHYIYLP